MMLEPNDPARLESRRKWQDSLERTPEDDEYRASFWWGYGLGWISAGVSVVVGALLAVWVSVS